MPEELTVQNEDGSVTYGKFNGETQIRVREFKGKNYVDIRRFVNGYPTKKGISMLVDALPECITILEKVEQKLIKKS